jgi:hypothetical protein
MHAATPRSAPFLLPAIDAHSGEIISEILDIGISQGLRYRLHEAAVMRASPGLEVLQLPHHVGPMLPLDTGNSAAAGVGASQIARNDVILPVSKAIWRPSARLRMGVIMRTILPCSLQR